MVAIGIRRSLLALLLAGGITAPAAAEVIYSFEPTSFSGTCNGPCAPEPAIFFTVEVTNNAAATGFSVHGTANFQDFASQPDVPLSLAGTGIDQITFNDGGVGQGFNSFASVSLGTLPGGQALYLNPGWIVDLDGGPAGVTGYLQYLGLNDDFTINLALPPAVTTGTFVTDNALVYPDCTFGLCSFSGIMTVSVVPEPASVALLAWGFLGLLIARFRRGLAHARGANYSVYS